MIARMIRNRIQPWAAWVEHGPLRPKLADALRLLDRGQKGVVTFEDLEARIYAKQHHAKIQHFYDEAVGYDVGSEPHKAWLHHELPKMSAEQLADVIAFLPHQSLHTPKPAVLRLVPDRLTISVAGELNMLLKEIGAPVMADDMLSRLLKTMGTQVVQARGRV